MIGIDLGIDSGIAKVLHGPMSIADCSPGSQPCSTPALKSPSNILSLGLFIELLVQLAKNFQWNLLVVVGNTTPEVK